MIGADGELLLTLVGIKEERHMMLIAKVDGAATELNELLEFRLANPTAIILM